MLILQKLQGFEVEPRISLIYYKQRAKPGLVGVLEKKKIQNHISGFVADFAGFAHIHALQGIPQAVWREPYTYTRSKTCRD